MRQNATVWVAVFNVRFIRQPIRYIDTHACAYMHALRTCAQKKEEEIEVEKESERKKIFLLQMLTHLCHLHWQTTPRQPTGPVRKKALKSLQKP